jgi:hypothetical protein
MSPTNGQSDSRGLYFQLEAILPHLDVSYRCGTICVCLVKLSGKVSVDRNTRSGSVTCASHGLATSGPLQSTEYGMSEDQSRQPAWRTWSARYR